jgi:hypothetical protein
VHGRNARNLSASLSLSQLAKVLCLSYYCLCLLFKKVGKKGRTHSAWKWWVLGGGECGGQEGEMAQPMHAHMNKWIKKLEK